MRFSLTFVTIDLSIYNETDYGNDANQPLLTLMRKLLNEAKSKPGIDLYQFKFNRRCHAGPYIIRRLDTEINHLYEISGCKIIEDDHPDSKGDPIVNRRPEFSSEEDAW